MKHRNAKAVESYRGVFDTNIPELGPLIWSVVEARNIAVQNTYPITVGSLWVFLYVLDPTHIHMLFPRRETIPLPRGSAICMPPGVKYRVDTTRHGKPAHHVWLLADGLEATSLEAMIQNPGYRTVFLDPHGTLHDNLIALVDAAERHKDQPFWTMQIYGKAVFDTLTSASVEKPGTYQIAANSAQQKPDPLVGRIIDYLQRNMKTRVRLSEMARALHASTSTISHRYRAFTGQSPMQTLRHMRMLQAKMLLARGLRLTDIASALGYCDEHHFSITFKDAEGVSPGAFVARARR